MKDSQTTEQEWKPCPFCKCEEIGFMEDAPAYHWQCGGCCIHVSAGEITAWNRKDDQ